MVNSILTAADVQFRRTRFPSPPAATYAVYTDDLETNGPDTDPGRVVIHNVTVEVYEPLPDDNKEAAIEAALNAQGIPWTKQDRYWLQDVQRYQVIYEFSYVEKRRT